jgi:hypothetical protein
VTRKTPIADRIRAAFKPGERKLSYYELMNRVFPHAEYPRAQRHQVNGGPPGCAMAFGKALRLMGLHVGDKETGRFIYRPPSENTP